MRHMCEESAMQTGACASSVLCAAHFDGESRPGGGALRRHRSDLERDESECRG
ncbi:hypothetical protein M3J09_010811 [Ascochyta lentis]